MDDSGEPALHTEAVDERRNLDRARYWVVYDGECAFCRLSMGWLKMMDWSNSIEPVDLHRYAPQVLERIPALTREQLMQEAHVIAPDDRVYEGFRAFRELALLLPPLWPIAPPLYAPGAEVAGRIAYEWVARHRHDLMPCPPGGACLTHQ
jgi:predicted DCC family thiol-disulfide oxidoreductase YuxK